MKWQFESDRPIYLQLVEILKADIIANDYQVGQKFPSVRELAQLASVNPNTMQKAMVELERQGFLESNRTSGRVISANFEKINTERDALATKKVKDFIEKMNKLGYSYHQIISMIEEVRYGSSRD
ncbi:MAG: GntR family transcriptional regulator [Clostridia bacterium]